MTISVNCLPFDVFPYNCFLCLDVKGSIKIKGIAIWRKKTKTKKECFALLDEMLSEADKKAIVEAEDLIEFHFTLDLWIRNNWLYDRSEEELESLSKAFGIDVPYFAADDLSSEILEAYQKHLKRTIK